MRGTAAGGSVHDKIRHSETRDAMQDIGACQSNEQQKLALGRVRKAGSNERTDARAGKTAARAIGGYAKAVRSRRAGEMYLMHVQGQGEIV